MSRPVRYGATESETRAGDAIEGSIRDALPDWIRNGRMVNGVSKSSGGSVNVAHKLGRKLQGYKVMSLKATGAAVYASSEGWDDKVIAIRFSGAASCDLWVW